MAVKKAGAAVSGNAIVEDAAVRQALASDLQRLDNVSAGLTERAVDYVLTGTDEAALAEVVNAHRQTGGYGSRLGFLQNRQNPPGVLGDFKLFLKNHGPHGLAELHRFGKVLAAAQPAWRVGLGYFGSSASQHDNLTS